MRINAVILSVIFTMACGSGSGQAPPDSGAIKAVPGTGLGPERIPDAGEGEAGAPASPLDASGGSASCPSPIGCGGDLAGTWDIVGGCASLENQPGCDRFMRIAASGTATFRTDGTYAMNIVSYGATLKMDDACVIAQSRSCTGSQCAQGSDGYCACRLFGGLSDATAGSYSTDGASLNMGQAPTDAGDGSFIFDAKVMAYCVQGETLVITAFPVANSWGVKQAVISFAKIH